MSANFSDDGRVAVIASSSGYAVLDPSSLETAMFAIDVGDAHECVAVSADGRLAVVGADRMCRDGQGRRPGVMLLDLTRGVGRPRVDRVVPMRSDDLFRTTRPGQLALHPRGTILARSDGQRVVTLIDLATGEELRRHAAACQESIAFSADGRWLICCGHDVTHVFGVDGGTHQLAASHVALSPNGAHVAIAWGGGFELQVVAFRGWSLAQPPRRGLRYQPPGFEHPEVEMLRFSPDGRRLAVVYMDSLPGWTHREHMLAVLDAETGAVVVHATNPATPPFGFGSPHALGFDPSGDRVLALTGEYRDWHLASRAQAVWIFDVARGEHLGSLALAEVAGRPVPCFRTATVVAGGEPGATTTVDQALVARTTHGFLACLTGGTVGATADPVFERVEPVRAWLSGQPLTPGAHDQDHIDDLAARYSQFSAEEASGRLAPGHTLADFVSATRGWTHVIPHLLTRARALMAARVSFGGTSLAISVSSLRAAVDEFAARGPDEQEALFSRMLEALVEEASSKAAALGKRARRETLARVVFVATIVALLALTAALILAL